MTCSVKSTAANAAWSSSPSRVLPSIAVRAVLRGASAGIVSTRKRAKRSRLPMQIATTRAIADVSRGCRRAMLYVAFSTAQLVTARRCISISSWQATALHRAGSALVLAARDLAPLVPRSYGCWLRRRSLSRHGTCDEISAFGDAACMEYAWRCL